MKETLKENKKEILGISFSYVAGMLVFVLLTQFGGFNFGSPDIEPMFTEAAGDQRYIGPPLCQPAVGDPRCRVKNVEYGLIDGVNSEQMSGWVYSQLNDSGDNRVLVTFTSTGASSIQYSKVVNLTVSRPEVAQYMEEQFPGKSVRQPMGFSLNPSEVVLTPGTYTIDAALVATGTRLDISPVLRTVQILN